MRKSWRPGKTGTRFKVDIPVDPYLTGIFLPTRFWEILMFQFIKCLFGFHGVTEVHHCKDGDIEVCRNCLKVKNIK